jgi:putative membrane protein
VTHITDIETQIKQAIDSVNEADQSNINSEQLTSLYHELMNIHGIIQNTRNDLQQKADQVTSGINTAADFVKDGLPTVEQKIHKAADFVRYDLPKVKSDIHEAANLIRTKLPAAEQAIHKAADFARNDLPGFEEKVRNAADRLRQVKSSINIYDYLTLTGQ